MCALTAEQSRRSDEAQKEQEAPAANCDTTRLRMDLSLDLLDRKPEVVQVANICGTISVHLSKVREGCMDEAMVRGATP
jgi:hypothetical protein